MQPHESDHGGDVDDDDDDFVPDSSFTCSCCCCRLDWRHKGKSEMMPGFLLGDQQHLAALLLLRSLTHDADSESGLGKQRDTEMKQKRVKSQKSPESSRAKKTEIGRIQELEGGRQGGQ